MRIKVHDFRLESGRKQCSIITGGEAPLVQIEDITLTLEQLEELYARVMDFNFEEEE